MSWTRKGGAAPGLGTLITHHKDVMFGIIGGAAYAGIGAITVGNFQAHVTVIVMLGIVINVNIFPDHLTIGYVIQKSRSAPSALGYVGNGGRVGVPLN